MLRVHEVTREREAQQGKVRRAEESGSQDLWARRLHAPLPAPAGRHSRGLGSSQNNGLGSLKSPLWPRSLP